MTFLLGTLCLNSRSMAYRLRLCRLWSSNLLKRLVLKARIAGSTRSSQMLSSSFVRRTASSLKVRMTSLLKMTRSLSKERREELKSKPSRELTNSLLSKGRTHESALKMVLSIFLPRKVPPCSDSRLKTSSSNALKVTSQNKMARLGRARFKGARHHRRSLISQSRLWLLPCRLTRNKWASLRLQRLIWALWSSNTLALVPKLKLKAPRTRPTKRLVDIMKCAEDSS